MFCSIGSLIKFGWCIQDIELAG